MAIRVRQTLVCAAVAGVLGIPASAIAAGERIMASFHNMGEPFFVVMARELRDEAKKLDARVTVVDGQANAAMQAVDLENALVQGGMRWSQR